MVSAWPLLPNLCPCHFKCNETKTTFSTTNSATDSTTQITKTTSAAATTTIENTVQITNLTSELPLTTSPSTNIISTTEDLKYENAMKQSISGTSLILF